MVLELVLAQDEEQNLSEWMGSRKRYRLIQRSKNELPTTCWTIRLLRTKVTKFSESQIRDYCQFDRTPESEFLNICHSLSSRTTGSKKYLEQTIYTPHRSMPEHCANVSARANSQNFLQRNHRKLSLRGRSGHLWWPKAQIREKIAHFDCFSAIKIHSSVLKMHRSIDCRCQIMYTKTEILNIFYPAG